jgi:hypothetical protein
VRLHPAATSYNVRRRDAELSGLDRRPARRWAPAGSFGGISSVGLYYIEFHDVDKTDGVFVADEVNEDSWEGKRASSPSLRTGSGRRRGDLVCSPDDCEDGCLPFSFQGISEPEIMRRASAA